MAKENRYKDDVACGVLPIYKEAGMTSHTVVARVKRLYSTMRVGHSGTLDPMATGVLVVLVGRAAKATEYIERESKKYTATLKLGITTDTEDTCGTVLSRAEPPSSVNTAEIEARFSGEQTQIPPMYSAIKIGGQKMLDLARQGITVDRPERRITVYSLKMKETDQKDEYSLDIECSGGTYVRTLCADIGAYLGCGGAMASLCRTENYGFDLSECYTLDQIEKMTEKERLSLLRDTETLFSSLPVLKIAPFFAKLCADGNSILQKKLGARYATGTRLRLYDEHGFFSLGEVVQKEDGLYVKPIKKFRL